MTDLSSEAARLALMEQAGCDARCGLTWGVLKGDGKSVLSHHRRDVADGLSKHTEVATIYVMPENFDLVAWMQGQHTD